MNEKDNDDRKDITCRINYWLDIVHSLTVPSSEQDAKMSVCFGCQVTQLTSDKWACIQKNAKIPNNNYWLPLILAKQETNTIGRGGHETHLETTTIE